MLKIQNREIPEAVVKHLEDHGIHPLMARVYAARGIDHIESIETSLARLLPPSGMMNVESMAQKLSQAIEKKSRLLIIADYDADGATACVVGLRALRAMGAQIDYLVPNRFEYGYGLTAEIVNLAHQQKNPDIIITVDNGIASVEGVQRANELGIRVLVTDHHLPGDVLPAAWDIINPNQQGCPFASKHLAGVGVMFYLALALRALLRQKGQQNLPNLSHLLDLVALGTVADVVKLDDNNRILVSHGLQLIRAGRAHAGIVALLEVAGRDASQLVSQDLGFTLGPRLNAAGRLTDMSLGIECLLTDDPARAKILAIELDRLNQQRRQIETTMQASAMVRLESFDPQEAYTVCLLDTQWHQGVIGIVASRLKDQFHRPTVAFAKGADGLIKGSGRSIAGLHLRDAIDRVSKIDPQLILQFGGHAAAAGLTLRECDFERFKALFEKVVQCLLTPEELQLTIYTDGSLPASLVSLESAQLIRQGVWGQGFGEPRFSDTFQVLRQKVLKDKHLKLTLGRGRKAFEAIFFNEVGPLSDSIFAIYRLNVNEYNGLQTPQLMLEHWHEISKLEVQ
jgi:single-stranded-DNA-specific exonuclease